MHTYLIKKEAAVEVEASSEGASSAASPWDLVATFSLLFRSTTEVISLASDLSELLSLGHSKEYFWVVVLLLAEKLRGKLAVCISCCFVIGSTASTSNESRFVWQSLHSKRPFSLSFDLCTTCKTARMFGVSSLTWKTRWKLKEWKIILLLIKRRVFV